MDLLTLPIGELTNQQITSRLHLLQDDKLALLKELQENAKISLALTKELDSRKSKKSVA